MYFYLVLLLLGTVSASRSRLIGGAKLVRKERSISGSYLVALKSDATAKQVDEFMRELKSLSDNLETPHQASRMNGLYTISKGITAELNQDALELVQQSSLIDFVEEDGLVEGSAVGWHLDRIDQASMPLDSTFAPGGTGEGVDIYVLDSGINMNHVEFENRAVYAGIDLVDEYYNTAYEGRDCNGHGTHVASLAAGKTAGVAKRATLYSLRVLDCRKMGKQSSVLKALDHVTNVRIKNRNQSMVIIMSLIGPKSYLLNSAIDRAVSEGIIVVTAAGNNRKDGCNYSPGSSPATINVGAIDIYNSLYQMGQFGTNYGKCIDIFAPGVRVRGANYRHKNGFMALSGTSMACPLVAGVAAILLEHFPTSSPTRIKDILVQMSTKNKINFSTFRPPLRGQQTQNRLLHISAESILNINESLSEAKLKLMTDISVNDTGHSTTEEAGRLQTAEMTPHKNQSTTTTIPGNTTQPHFPTTHQPTTPETPGTLIKVVLKEPCMPSMGEKMWNNKNYIIQYMNSATTSKNNMTYFTTIYQYDPEAEDYSVQCFLLYKRTQAMFTEAAVKNQIVYLLVPYVVNDVEYYCVGLKRRKNGQSKLLHLIGLKPAEADQIYNTYKKFNYELISERYVVVKDKIKANSIYKLSQSTQAVLRYRALSYSSLMNKIVEGQRKGYHIKDLSSYTLKGETNYSLLLSKNVDELQYRWVLRSRQRIKGTLKTLTKQELYPLAIVSTNLGSSEPHYLVSLTSTIA